MSLTVPSASSIGGRSASIRVDAPETGSILAEFGNRVAQKAVAWRDEQLQRQGRQVQLDITRDLGQARQELEATVTDPAALGSAWDAKVAEIRDRYIVPGMDPKLTEDLTLDFQSLSDRHTLDLGNRVIALNQSQAQADWVTTRGRIAAEAVNADPTTFGAYLEVGDAAIDAQTGLSPEQKAIEKQNLRREVYGNRADALITTNPAAFLEAAKAGEWNVLGEDLAARQRAAEKAVAEQAAVAAKNAAMDAQKQSDDIGKRLGEIANIAGLGRVAADEAFLNDPVVKAHPRYAEAQAAIALREETPGLRVMTVAELDKLIATEQAKPITSEYQNERLKVLRTWRAEAATKQEADTVGWAIEAGLAVPELPPFDPANPAGFVAGLQQRLSFDQAARSQGYTRGTAVFTPAEAEEVKAAIDPKTSDPDTRLGMARAFSALGDDAARYLTGSVLTADPAFSRATELITLTGSDQVAKEILRGQQAIETKTVDMPTQPEILTIFKEVTQGAFNDNTARKAQLIEAAKAAYAANAAGLDPASKEAIDAFGMAVQRVLGAVPDRNGEYTIGGLQEINGAPVLLPPGIAVAQVETALDAVRDQLTGQYTLETLPAETRNAVTSGMVRILPEPPPMTEEQRFAILQAASVNGTIPDLGADPAERLATVTFRPVYGRNGRQTDAYEMVYIQNGVPVKVRQKGDPDGKPYRFSLSDLIREASRGD